MIKVVDVAFVRFGVPDLDEMEAFLVDFGLTVSQRDEERLYVRGSDPSPYVHVTERGEVGFRASLTAAAGPGSATRISSSTWRRTGTS